MCLRFSPVGNRGRYEDSGLIFRFDFVPNVRVGFVQNCSGDDDFSVIEEFGNDIGLCRFETIMFQYIISL